MTIVRQLVEAFEPYENLCWTVEVKTTTGGGGSFWETIAAFNVKVAAEDYADRCGTASGYTYRVRGRDEHGRWHVLGDAQSRREAQDALIRAAAPAQWKREREEREAQQNAERNRQHLLNWAKSEKAKS